MASVKHYFTGKGGSAEDIANSAMQALEDSNIFFDEELKKFGEYVVVLGKEGLAGWTPARVSGITKWFSTAYIGSLCKRNKIKCICSVDDGRKTYIITPAGVEELYQKYLKKLER